MKKCLLYTYLIATFFLSWNTAGAKIRFSPEEKKAQGSRYYNWDTNAQLRSKVNQMTKSVTYFDYDDFGNLAKSYNGNEELYKTPDAVGNLYKTQDRSDRKYGKGGKLLQDEKHYYKYDQQGNLVHKIPRDITKALVFERATNWIDRLAGNKTEETRLQQEHESWQQGDTACKWLANGMLESVTNPDGKVVSFEYDALGRRTAKIANKEIFRYFWDGNVLIHEWKYDLKQRPKLVVDEDDLVYSHSEPIENLITWIYEGGSFVPSAKIVGKEKFSIINDYIGRPVQVYNETGDVVWETDYDIYGGLREFKGDRGFMPFRQLGQYEDVETGLYYNRFRYYNPETGLYLSQDPIGLGGNNPNFYAYVFDANSQVDPFGLEIPFGFKSYGQLKQFATEIQSGIAKTGNGSGSSVLLQGSSVTGRSYKTGELFDVGRTSDFDVAIVNSELLKKAEQLGLSKPGSGRSFPLDLDNPERAKALGLDKLQEKLSARMGRDVKFKDF